MTQNDFIPALRFPALTPWYDRTVAWSTREYLTKGRLLAAADVKAGEHVLDLGCGTGTLLLRLAAGVPGAKLTGLDADPVMLNQAIAKAKAAIVDAEFVTGWSHELPFANQQFDVALSSLFFHHLQPQAKHRSLAELLRVLRPGGRLLVADFGRSAAWHHRLAFHVVRLLDGYSNTRDHALGRLDGFVVDAGFEEVRVLASLPVPVGSIDLLTATRAD